MALFSDFASANEESESSALTITMLQEAIYRIQGMTAPPLREAYDTIMMTPRSLRSLQDEAEAVLQPRFHPNAGPDMLFGFRVLQDPNLVRRVQYRFPRSKKRRIRKKWAKRQENWRDEDLVLFVNHSELARMHMRMVERVQREFWKAIAIPQEFL